MQFIIDNYCLEKNIYSLAFNDDVAKELLDHQLNVMLVGDNESITLLPENVTIEVSHKVYEMINYCDNFDVVFINEQGRGYLCYNNRSEDNALVLTQRCNSNCIMCPTAEGIRRKDNVALSPLEVLQLIKYIPSDTKHITITGGEPFLIRDIIFDILAECKKRLNSTTFLLLTNGRAFAYKDYVDKFINTKPDNIVVGIPIHGYNPTTHDYITQAKGSFLQTMVGIRNLLNNNVNVEIRLVISKLNMDFIDKIADLIINEIPDVSSVKFMGLEMLGNAAKHQDKVWIPYKVAFEKSKSAILKIIKSGIDVRLYNFPLCAVDEEFHMICAKSITDYKVKFPDECDSCSKKSICGGIFSGTMRLSKDEVYPWR